MDRTLQALDPADVTVHRRGRGKPVVLLHCLGMDWHFWDVLEPLTDQFELIAYSFPGHHDSRLPKGQYGEAADDSDWARGAELSVGTDVWGDVDEVIQAEVVTNRCTDDTPADDPDFLFFHFQPPCFLLE